MTKRKLNKTHIAILLDRSGSMGSIVSDVIGGYNNFLKDQKAAKGECTLTLVQFDSEGIDTLHEHAGIQSVPELTTSTYQPRGATPLLDALGQTLERTQRALENINAKDRPQNIMFVVVTDGEENASHKFTKAQIKAAIEQHERDGWNFVFLGANQDAFAEAGAIGVPMAAAASFRPTGQSVRAAYAGMSANSLRYRATGSRTALHWTSAQRAAMADDDDGTVTSTHTAPTASQPTQRLNWKRRSK